mgnify:CR=1 FL=1
MDRNTFLVAAAKAAEIRFRAEAAFAAARDMEAAARNAKQRRNISDQRIAQLKASSALRGSAPDRERVNAEIARHQFERDEAQNEMTAAEKITSEYLAIAQPLAMQRDSTRAQVETWRRELSAADSANRPSLILASDGGNGSRVGVNYNG